MKNKPNPKFRALYNPFTKTLLVRYGNALTQHIFEEIEEWTKVSFNADENHPNYLHIQIDYDEMFQLLFYPRVDGSQELNEELGTYYNSFGKNTQKRIKIVQNDMEWNVYLHLFLNASALEYEMFCESKYLTLQECEKILTSKER